MSGETVTLVSNDGAEFQLDKEKCKLSETLTQLFEDVEQTDEKIELKYPGKIVELAVNYINSYFEEREKAQSEGRPFLAEVELTSNQNYESDEWEKKFVPSDVPSLLSIAELTHFLKIKPLTNLIFSTIGRKMQNKRPEEIQELFDLEPFEPEMYEFIDENNCWDT